MNPKRAQHRARSIACVALASAVAVSLTACGGGSEEAAPAQEESKPRTLLVLEGEWRVTPLPTGDQTTMPEPIGTIDFKDKADGEFVTPDGFFIDIAWESTGPNSMAITHDEGFTPCVIGEVTTGFVLNRPGYLLTTDCNGESTTYGLLP